MNKDPLVFIQHMLESINLIENFTKNITKEQFLNNQLIQSGVVRQLEIIGEAAKHLPKEFTQKYQVIPWSEIAKTRDKLIHYYFDVNLNLTWNIIEKDITPLKSQLQTILKELK